MKSAYLEPNITTMMNQFVNTSKLSCSIFGKMLVQVIFFYDNADSPFKNVKEYDNDKVCKSEVFGLDAECVQFPMEIFPDDPIALEDYCRTKAAHDKKLKAIGIIELIFFHPNVRYLNEDISKKDGSRKALYSALFWPNKDLYQRVIFYEDHGLLPGASPEHPKPPLREEDLEPRFDWRFIDQGWNVGVVPDNPPYEDFFKPVAKIEIL